MEMRRKRERMVFQDFFFEKITTHFIHAGQRNRTNRWKRFEISFGVCYTILYKYGDTYSILPKFSTWLIYGWMFMYSGQPVFLLKIFWLTCGFCWFLFLFFLFLICFFCEVFFLFFIIITMQQATNPLLPVKIVPSSLFTNSRLWEWNYLMWYLLRLLKLVYYSPFPVTLSGFHLGKLSAWHWHILTGVTFCVLPVFFVFVKWALYWSPNLPWKILSPGMK